jgi:choline dehydrogenase
VADDRPRVHRISGLRVIDASIMPLIASGKTNTPEVMIAERATATIKWDAPGRVESSIGTPAR